MAHEPDPAFELWWAEQDMSLPHLVSIGDDGRADVRAIIKIIAERAFQAAGLSALHDAKTELDVMDDKITKRIDTVEKLMEGYINHIDGMSEKVHNMYHHDLGDSWEECPHLLCRESVRTLRAE